MAKVSFINSIFFLIIITVCLGFMYGQPVRTVYIEKDGSPGYSKTNDKLLFLIKGTQVESITEQPSYFAGLATALVISIGGFIFSMHNWEKARKCKEE